MFTIVVEFTSTVVNDFRWFLSQFSTNHLEILQALFSSDAATTLEIYDVKASPFST